MKNKEFIERLERLKIANRATWAEAAKLVGISRAMVGFIRQGKYPVSESVAMALVRAEREAGLNPRAREIIESISAEARKRKPTITPKDIERGFLELEVDYLAGVPPREHPRTTITLRRPDARKSAKLLADILVDESPHSVLLECLPVELATEAFLNKLTPFAYDALVETALALVFGLELQKRIRSLD